MLQPLFLYTYVIFSFQFYTASGKYIGEISKNGTYFSSKTYWSIWQSMGHNGKIPFLPGHHLNPPLKSHIYTSLVIKAMAFWEISPLAPTLYTK